MTLNLNLHHKNIVMLQRKVQLKKEWPNNMKQNQSLWQESNSSQRRENKDSSQKKDSLRRASKQRLTYVSSSKIKLRNWKSITPNMRSRMIAKLLWLQTSMKVLKKLRSKLGLLHRAWKNRLYWSTLNKKPRKEMKFWKRIEDLMITFRNWRMTMKPLLPNRSRSGMKFTLDLTNRMVLTKMECS